MARSAMSASIRIRGKWRSGGTYWIWELLTADGHVVNTSEPFETRDDCEADAVRQGLPCVGLAARRHRVHRTVPITRSPNGPSLDLSCDRSGLWHWQRLDTAGELVEKSMYAFLTKDECIADARKNGYSPPLSSDDAEHYVR
jgi:hypothetical protein